MAKDIRFNQVGSPGLDTPLPREPKSPSRRRFQFSLVTVLLSMTTIGLALALFVPRIHQAWMNRVPQPMDRSWMDGRMTVRAANAGNDTAVVLNAVWPQPASSHTILYTIWAVNRRNDHQLLLQSCRALGTFDHNCSYDRYPPAVGAPFCVVCDYEIWDGEPGSGRLLAKDSVSSEWYGEEP